MAILEATEISGLACPAYNSGASNKLYVDTISSNIVNQITNPTYISTQSISGGTFITNGLTMRGDTISGLADPIWPSSAANKHYVDTISGALDARIDALGGFDTANYMASTTIIERFYPSQQGHYFTGSGAKLTSAYLSANRVLDRFDHSLYIVSSAGIERFTDSSNVNWTKITAISSGFDGRLDDLEDNDVFDHTLYSVSANLYNKTWIDTFSGSIDSRIDALEGASEITWLSLANVSTAALWAKGWLDSSGQQVTSTINSGTKYTATYQWFVASGEKLSTISGSLSDRINALGGFDPENYITSTSAISRFADSSNIVGRFLPSTSMINKSDGDVLTWIAADNVWSSQASTGGLDGATISSNFFTKTSGQILWDFSSNAKNLFAHSSNINKRFVASGIVLTSISSQHISGGSIIGQLKYPPITFNIGNIRLSAQQNINLARFDCGDGKKAYIWQASACGSGGTSISGMNIEMLAGSTLPLDGSDSIYKTSSQILQLGYPLATSTAGDHIEIRFMYSGTQTGANSIEGTGIQFGTGFMNISVY